MISGFAASRVIFSLVVLFIAGLRLVELQISRRHATALLARGGVEFGQKHYPWMMVLHTTFFISILAELWFLNPPFHPSLAAISGVLFLAGFLLRWWAISTLGPFWSTRVIRVEGDRQIREGPYRFLSHPNYLGVALEIATLPLIHGCWRSALLFSLLDFWILRVRIRCENRALGGE